jgi:hypothetical protein
MAGDKMKMDNKMETPLKLLSLRLVSNLSSELKKDSRQAGMTDADKYPIY